MGIKVTPPPPLALIADRFSDTCICDVVLKMSAYELLPVPQVGERVDMPPVSR